MKNGENDDEDIKPALFLAEKDEDGRWTFAIRATDEEAPEKRSSIITDLFNTENRGWKTPRSVIKGYVVFLEIGYGRWQSVETTEQCRGKVLLAVPQQVATRMKIGPTQGSGYWCITAEPITVASAELALTASGIIQETPDCIAEIEFSDGVRSKGSWLGRKNLLPTICGIEGATNVRPCAGARGALSARSIEGKNRVELTTEGRLSGDFDVEIRFDPKDTIPSWSQRLTFVENAYTHQGPGLAHSEWQQLEDWHGLASFGQADIKPEALAWDENPGEMDDFCEAIYAKGSADRAEGDIAELAQFAFQGTQNPWTMIKVLQDSAMMRPRLRPGWKGRNWEILAPALHFAGYAESAEVYVVNGAIGERLANAFKDVVTANKGRPFRRMPLPGAPALYGFFGGNAADIARRLEWNITAAAIDSPAINGRFAETTRRIKQPERSYWSWQSNRFKNRRDDESAVQLIHERHPEDRDHDIYKIESPRGTLATLSRTAAFAYAYRIGKKTVFRHGDAVIAALEPDARLPAEIALALRTRHLANPGSADRCILYPASGADIRLLKAAMGPIFVNGAKEERTLTELSLHARLRGGAQRLIWKDSKISLNPENIIESKNEY
ncbi:hypothetical protein M2323_001767 [Rhodoblastus acidophilus]|uniref:hypothetical protein n=1 Tax=Rhodoblastus acidophilus TaxID=1074 RepID=UPI002225136A|nr:hypothetical protein [Rhodoblastus acidophilus]MCW2283801.1 hypothetical protein [Rhodoblastus acidophilus]MCW2332850.1 hypothetical protein [Rhodoblastus acidophilus]